LTVLAGLQSPCRLRQVEPDALVLGYPPVCATSCASPPTPFYQIGMYDQTVPFYLVARRLVATVTNWRWASTPNQRQVPTTAAWIAEWESLRTATR
jgi:hypothetical protein